MPRGRPRGSRSRTQQGSQAYDSDLFASLIDENAYILRQLEAHTRIKDCVFDAPGWVAMKLALTREEAAVKIARAQKGTS